MKVKCVLNICFLGYCHIWLQVGTFGVLRSQFPEKCSSSFESVPFKDTNFRSTQIVHIKYKTLYTIWYQLYNLKNVKNTHGGALLQVKLQASLTVTLLPGYFSGFLNCPNGTKSRKAYIPLVMLVINEKKCIK